MQIYTSVLFINSQFSLYSPLICHSNFSFIYLYFVTYTCHSIPIGYFTSRKEETSGDSKSRVTALSKSAFLSELTLFFTYVTHVFVGTLKIKPETDYYSSRQ